MTKKLTRIQVPLLITYYLEIDNTPVAEKEVSPILDIDKAQIETWAIEAGVSTERYIVQWLTRNLTNTLFNDEAEKANFLKLANKHKSSLKIEVSLSGDIKWNIPIADEKN